MNISIGCDHGGVNLKPLVVATLESLGHQVIDRGTHSADRVDYPDYAAEVCNDIQSGRADAGVLLCGTGLGMSITANKFRGIRATLCHDSFSARFSREHNDSNVLCMGGRLLGPDLAGEVLRVWCATEFEGGRHTRRLERIATLESRQMEASR